ncbi:MULTISPECIES: sugar ABC transporter permease [Paenibacillus]|uniref:Sugar ABC transporter permease n=1 Tax=Paenibacillus baimaensis TaxID=2982185 RepID=A0ABT2UDL2_9BACL|nr:MULTISPECIES: sugar ABC transporter permease [unclassified Paenibacillus]MCU6792728.1 sugar ABC transporter permease [Paenibacillus sp. WQ 127069]OMF11044.1 protein lplB [Paenibacillus sp. FSL H7-0331]
MKMALKELKRDRWLYLMLLPGVLYFLVFKYIPMWGLVIAFQNYMPFLGIMKSEWVGFAHFQYLFASPDFWMLMRNTVILAVYNIFFFFPLPIIVALMLNEIRHEFYKRVVVSLIYVPHFLSWVIVVSFFYSFFSIKDGIINEMIQSLGFEKIHFLDSAEWFRSMVTLEVIWKETGWGTIIFMAALAGVNPQLYEAARMDGANRWRQLYHITLPSIRSTIIILLILRLGSFLDNGFEQIFLMLNALNREVGEVFDTYVYLVGIQGGQFSFSTAVGMFKAVVGLVLVLITNRLAKKFGEEGIY